MIIYNGTDARFLLNDTGDDYFEKHSGYYEARYSLEEFNLFFSKNSIDALERVFLNKELEVSEGGFYEYNRLAQNNANRYGYFPWFLKQQKNIDEILVAITNVYKRLFNELDTSKRNLVIEKFTTFLTIINIENATLAHDKSVEYMCIVKYLDQFIDNKVIKEIIYNAVYNNLEKYNKDSFRFVSPNVDCFHLTTKDIETIKSADKYYIMLRESNELKPYINNNELPYEEQKERFCLRFKENER